MSDSKSEGAGSIFSNPNAILALLTIVGGVWLVSQRLSSGRPVVAAGGSREFVGDQKLEVRLWEDPFRGGGNEGRATSGAGGSAVDDLHTLVDQIRRRSGTCGVLLLPVLVAGGQYSEDQESRIRSRFAIVSALGESGYAPEDAEHIGALRLPWLTRQELERARKETPATLSRLWEETWHETSSAGDSPNLAAKANPRVKRFRHLGAELGEQPAAMDIRYEWYRPRTFAPGSFDKDRNPSVRRHVLVLWLDESFFEDLPLLRLPLLLERLVEADSVALLGGQLGTWSSASNSPNRVALIGPWRSSTLRAMLPNWQPHGMPVVPPGYENPDLRRAAEKVLGQVELFCATASAADEVLVSGPQARHPRLTVGRYLQEMAGFKRFQNLAPTDSQLANEIINELALRRVDLNDPKQHVVLISEWDTFYGRMLSLTYRAQRSERARRSGRPGLEKLPDRAEFIRNHVRGASELERAPGNFHSFVYLRGLDGQTVGASSLRDANPRGGGPAGGTRRVSLEELPRWQPDVDKAEGQAQLDYLGRLGDQIEQLQHTLKRTAQGEILAIGIVGSDVYDTLLILQALRHRFTSALFFTTDLDVRFLHPAERDWARNLIVASGYGFSLHPSLQGSTAPFRDSIQTAQFAATLAALGNKPLAGLREIPPRRFEVGNRAAVDLSVDSLPRGEVRPDHTSPGELWLHPLTRSEAYRESRKPVHVSAVEGAPGKESPQLARGLSPATVRGGFGVTAFLLLLVGISWLVPSLRSLTWLCRSSLRKILEYSEEDIGGADGAEAILHWIQANHAADPVARWLWPHVEPFVHQLGQPSVAANQGVGGTWQREDLLAGLVTELVRRLNQLLRQEFHEGATRLELPLPADRVSGVTAAWARQRYSPLRTTLGYREARRSIDAFLDRVASTASPPANTDANAPVAAESGTGRHFRTRLKTWFPTLARAAVTTINLVFGTLTPPRRPPGGDKQTAHQIALDAALAARDSTDGIFRVRCRRIMTCWITAGLFGAILVGFAGIIHHQTFGTAEGEAFSLRNGTSAWPAAIVRLLVFFLAVHWSIGLAHRMRETFLVLTRRFRFSPLPVGSKSSLTETGCARAIWYDYRKDSRFRRQWWRICLVGVLYIALLIAINRALGGSIFSPTRGEVASDLGRTVLFLAVFSFLALALFTADTAMRCRRFIEDLSEGPTLYPDATQQHFCREMGGLDKRYIDEWLDLQLIAELTERVGRLVYYPVVLFLLLLVARNNYWDNWTWPTALVITFGFNLVVGLASVVILQRAAKEAKRKAEQTLAAKVKQLQARAAPSAAENNAAQAEKILKEIRELHRGAFVPFWENPVVGAIFLSSGGTTLLQVAIWFMSR